MAKTTSKEVVSTSTASKEINQEQKEKKISSNSIKSSPKISAKEKPSAAKNVNKNNSQPSTPTLSAPKLTNGSSQQSAPARISNGASGQQAVSGQQQETCHEREKLFPRVTTPSKTMSLAQKIEISTPKNSTFDVLGSIMKDMTK